MEKIFVIVIGVLAISFLVTLYFGLRNTYVYNARGRGINAVYRYLDTLIKNGTYVMGFDYYDKFLIDYNFLWGKKPFRFGKYSAVKDEYLELLKPYFEEK